MNRRAVLGKNGAQDPARPWAGKGAVSGAALETALDLAQQPSAAGAPRSRQDRCGSVIL